MINKKRESTFRSSQYNIQINSIIKQWHSLNDSSYEILLEITNTILSLADKSPFSLISSQYQIKEDEIQLNHTIQQLSLQLESFNDLYSQLHHLYLEILNLLSKSESISHSINNNDIISSYSLLLKDYRRDLVLKHSIYQTIVSSYHHHVFIPHHTLMLYLSGWLYQPNISKDHLSSLNSFFSI